MQCVSSVQLHKDLCRGPRAGGVLSSMSRFSYRGLVSASANYLRVGAADQIADACNADADVC